MTEFERIKNMDDVEFAVYINKLQMNAIENYKKGLSPNGYFENLKMLRSEVKTT